MFLSGTSLVFLSSLSASSPTATHPSVMVYGTLIILLNEKLGLEFFEESEPLSDPPPLASALLKRKIPRELSTVDKILPDLNL